MDNNQNNNMNNNQFNQDYNQNQYNNNDMNNGYQQNQGYNQNMNNNYQPNQNYNQNQYNNMNNGYRPNQGYNQNMNNGYQQNQGYNQNMNNGYQPGPSMPNNSKKYSWKGIVAAVLIIIIIIGAVSGKKSDTSGNNSSSNNSGKTSTNTSSGNSGSSTKSGKCFSSSVNVVKTDDFSISIPVDFKDEGYKNQKIYQAKIDDGGKSYNINISITQYSSFKDPHDLIEAYNKDINTEKINNIEFLYIIKNGDMGYGKSYVYAALINNKVYGITYTSYTLSDENATYGTECFNDILKTISVN